MWLDGSLPPSSRRWCRLNGPKCNCSGTVSVVAQTAEETSFSPTVYEAFMPDTDVHATIKPLVMCFLEELMKNYWGPLYNYIEANPQLIQSAPGFLLDHESVIVYMGRTHIAVEYIGPEFVEKLKPRGNLQVQYHDYSTRECNLLEQIIGFEYDSTLDVVMSLPSVSEGFLLPTNRGWDKLLELGWNFSAQESVMGFNAPCPEPMEGKFARIVNGTFFDADESGLRTRRVKWLDFFPIFFDGSDEEVDRIRFNLEKMQEVVEADARYKYPVPDDFKYVQLPKINMFIEKWGSRESSEPEITSFLSEPENQFILTMKFGAVSIHPELTCQWQSEAKPDIRPDFFVVQPSGYADIVEFKLPDIPRNVVVGSTNRETFGAWLNSHISQTRVYSNYFEDPNNRKWFEQTYGFKVHKPRRWLVVGRRHDFDSDVWREIMHDFNSLEIITFDDLVDGVVAQFYR